MSRKSASKRKGATKSTKSETQPTCKWYLVSFYQTNGDINSTRYSESMLPEEYSKALADNKHSIVKDGVTVYIDEFDSEQECKAAQGDAELVDSVFKIVEANDAKQSNQEDAKSSEIGDSMQRWKSWQRDRFMQVI